ncbi:MAG: UDP-N-acetylmuramoyl-L-alanyl-D-glutamate--2,6-diaminopimelate ligase, partial [candidate division Zixibacteria bacterium]|nr:UDP-N-acetylmuramoyl-L-alanyl-D-glutamate--2,6-diaminopimelate ligase [candidate division Zixibacteria bacterium]
GMVNSLVYDTTIDQFKAERTTPDSVEMQFYLSEMVKAKCEYAVIEVSSHALMLNRVDNIDLQIGLYTNFSRDHLDFHKSMENYLEAKKLLLDKIAEKNSCAVVNQDVPEFVSMIDDYQSDVLSYSSAGNEADIKIDAAKLSPTMSLFNLVMPDSSCEVWFNLPGRYNLANAACAASAGVALGIGKDNIKKGLESAKPVPGRYRPVILGQPFSVVIDYAHTPDALARLCLSAREITQGNILTLFGCGGDRDSGKRPMMAEAASTNSDFVILTSDNPRTENPEKIFEETIPGMIDDNYEVISDRSEAIRTIIGRAKKDDTVLIAGKGAEDYQEIGTTRFPFNDKKEIENALEAFGYKQVKAG